MFSTLYSSYLGSAFSGANLAKYITVVVLYVAMIVAVVYFEAAKRKIPVQYANRQSNETLIFLLSLIAQELSQLSLLQH